MDLQERLDSARPQVRSGVRTSDDGVEVEVCVTGEGVWWHPVAAIEPAIHAAEQWSLLARTSEAITDEFRAQRLRGDVLASTLPCASEAMEAP